MDVHHLKFTLGKDIASESIIVKDETQETEQGKVYYEANEARRLAEIVLGEGRERGRPKHGEGQRSFGPE